MHGRIWAVPNLLRGVSYHMVRGAGARRRLPGLNTAILQVLSRLPLFFNSGSLLVPSALIPNRCSADRLARPVFVGTYLVCVVNTLSCGLLKITFSGYGVLVR